MIKVGFVGAGRRMQEYYLPIIRAMDRLKLFNVVGFWTRSSITAQQAEQATLVRSMALPQLLEASDLIIVCVPAHALETCFRDINYLSKKPILIETPVMSSHIAELSKSDSRIISAAENWPFRPAEQLKRTILESGVMGPVRAVSNQFRGYEYHAFAMMRQSFRHMGDVPTAATGTSFSLGPISFINDEGQSKTLDENWDIGVVELSGGGKLVHNFNSVHSRCKVRGNRGITAVTALGHITTDDISTMKIDVLSDGRPVNVPVNVTYERGVPTCARVELHGKKFNWWADHDIYLDEQQLSTAALLKEMHRCVSTNNPAIQPYPAWQAWLDYQCVSMLRASAVNGQKLGFSPPPWLR